VGFVSLARIWSLPTRCDSSSPLMRAPAIAPPPRKPIRRAARGSRCVMVASTVVDPRLEWRGRPAGFVARRPSFVDVGRPPTPRETRPVLSSFAVSRSRPLLALGLAGLTVLGAACGGASGQAPADPVAGDAAARVDAAAPDRPDV